MPQRFAVGFWKKLAATALLSVSLVATAGAAPASASVSTSGPGSAAPVDRVAVAISSTNIGDKTTSGVWESDATTISIQSRTATDTPTDTPDDTTTDTPGRPVTLPEIWNDAVIVSGLALYAAGMKIRRQL